MGAAIKRVSGECANCQLEDQKGSLAVINNSGHQAIAFGGHIRANPQKRQLRIEPVESEQQQAFGH